MNEPLNFHLIYKHKTIIKYNTGSKSDFEKLEHDILLKFTAYKNKSATVQALSSTLIKDTEGLQAHEVAFLTLLMSNLDLDDDCYELYRLKNEMELSGYNKLATKLASHSLEKKNYIKISAEATGYDFNGNAEYSTFITITQQGIGWILSNQDKLEFKVQENNKGNILPF